MKRTEKDSPWAGFYWFLVASLGVLVLAHRLNEAPLKFDGLTYSSVAKHVVETGVWYPLHYTHSAFDEYIVHPPLLIWLQALIFQVLPIVDSTARLLPIAFGLGSIGMLFAWVRCFAGSWAGLVSVLFLLTSYPYVKYASDFYFDGPLVFFFIGGMWSYVAATRANGRRARLLEALFGVCLAGAFFTKGLVAGALFAGTFVYPFVKPKIRKQIARWSRAWWTGLAVAAFLAGLWLVFGHGLEFLAGYAKVSVGDRAVTKSWIDSLGFLWFLVFKGTFSTLVLGLSLLVLYRRRETVPPDVEVGLLTSFFVFAGFTFAGKTHEHYLLPFYPGAALAVGYTWRSVRPLFEKRALFALGAFVVAVSLFLACYPGRVRTNRTENLRLASHWIAEKCEVGKIGHVAFTQSVTEKWLGLGIVLWYLPVEATHFDVAPASLPPEGLLVLAPGEKAPPGWEAVTPPHWKGDRIQPFIVYQPVSSGSCVGAP